MGLRKKKSLIDQASDYVEAAVEQVKPQLESAMASAKDKAGPVIADARTKAAPVIAAAAEKAAEASQAAADKVSEAAAPKKKGGKLKKLLLLTGLAAGIAFVAKKLRAGSAQADSWQSSYKPTPAPAPAAPAPSPAPSAAGTTDDEGGSSPDEALADQAEAPRPVTTPDDPAEVVDVDKQA